VYAPGTLERVSDWRSYDAVAETYERIHAPRLREPARDLILAADLPAGARVLDVGTGTGVAAAEAVSAVGDGGSVIGIDGSTGMLAVGPRAAALRTIAALGSTCRSVAPRSTPSSATSSSPISRSTRPPPRLLGCSARRPAPR
jgi:SAM-dependent methyltransferase